MEKAEMKKAQMTKALFTILFMLAVTVVFVAAPTAIHLLTRERVRINEELVFRKAILAAAGRVDPSASPEELDALYDRIVGEVRAPDGGVAYYRIQGGGYVVVLSGPGLWGTITAAVGFAGDGETLTGIEFIRQNETPGLGARITEEWFKKQFAGKQGPFTFVPEGQPAGTDQFDAITGATSTTTAVRDILNRAVERIGELTSAAGR